MRFTPLQSPAPREGGGGARVTPGSYSMGGGDETRLRLVDAHGDASPKTPTNWRSPPKPKTPLTGPLLWLKSVQRAQLPKAENAVLVALVSYVDYHTGICYPSIATLARDARYSQRSVQRALKKLTNAGLVEVLNAAKGGFGAGGRGISNRFQLHLDRLQALAGHRTKIQEKGDTASKKPRHHVAERVTFDTEKGDTTPPKHTNEQTREHTTTTTSDGGGGGGAALRSGGEERQTSGGKAESVALLVAAGVRLPTAIELAEALPLDVIAAGPEWMAENSKACSSPQGVLVSALRDGTVAAWREQRDKAIRESEIRQREARVARNRPARVAAYQRIANSLGTPDSPAKADAQERAWQTITSVWPDLSSLADAEVIPDDQLFDSAQPPGPLMNALLQRAKEVLKERAAAKAPGGCSSANPTTPGQDTPPPQRKDSPP